MPFLTNDPLPQCLQTSSDIALSPPIGNRRGCGRYLLEVKCLLAVMGRATRRRWAPLYLHGLIGPDGRESLQPLAARLGLGGHDQLQHFIASPARDDAPLRRVPVGEADALVGGPDAVLVVDDTAPPEKGERSVGVARQDCGG